MTILVTRNAEARVRGFLSSAMLEIASGVYTSPNMTAAVRDRVWAVLVKWRLGARDDGAIMTWPDASVPGGQSILVLGEPPTDLAEALEIVLARKRLTEDELRSLINQIDEPPF